MPWSFLYYNEDVKAAVEQGLDAGHLADLAMAKKILEEFGPHELPAKLSKAMGGGLYEFRLIGEETSERIFYCYLSGQRLVYLHVFTKTTQKTPPKEFKLAQTRLTDVMQKERESVATGAAKFRKEGKHARRK